jgi:hypothetical protein
MGLPHAPLPEPSSAVLSVRKFPFLEMSPFSDVGTAFHQLQPRCWFDRSQLSGWPKAPKAHFERADSIIICEKVH